MASTVEGCRAEWCSSARRSASLGVMLQFRRLRARARVFGGVFAPTSAPRPAVVSDMWLPRLGTYRTLPE
eukprot:2754822-Prymnesium_polylepis.1